MALSPGWGALLIDLREHGNSRSMPPPHTLAAAATDLADLVQEQKLSGLVGHSFGGKVVLKARSELDLEFSAIIDASPSASPDALESDGQHRSVAVSALRVLETLPAVFASRTELIEALEARGLARMVGQFLATNLERTGDGQWEWAVDLVAIRSLLASYFATDLWPDVTAVPSRLEFVAASRQSALSAVDLTRLAALSESHSFVRTQVVDSGHWVHVDAPAPLLEILRTLTSQGDSVGARIGAAD